MQIGLGLRLFLGVGLRLGLFGLRLFLGVGRVSRVSFFHFSL
jgi:hypothetical protein